MFNNTEVILLKNVNNKENENKIKRKMSIIKPKKIDSLIENKYITLKGIITYVLDRYKHIIGLLLIVFSIYILGILYFFNVGQTIQKLSFALSIISILSTIYLGIRREKAKIHTNVVYFFDDIKKFHVSVEMFSSNLSTCVIRLERIKLFNEEKKLIKSDKFSDFEKLLDEESLKSHIVNGDDILVFEIIGYKINILESLYGRNYKYPKTCFLKLSFKRYDGKKNIDVLIGLKTKDKWIKKLAFYSKFFLLDINSLNVVLIAINGIPYSSSPLTKSFK